ncbi:unnamed protein product, partial [Ectocarpus sp. 12 AP-2014]
MVHSAVARSGRWEEVLVLLGVMRSEGVAPDHFAFGAAVNACAKGGQWERAVALLDQVSLGSVRGVVPTATQFSCDSEACRYGRLE